jgi:hypothetical protein
MPAERLTDLQREVEEISHILRAIVISAKRNRQTNEK